MIAKIQRDRMIYSLAMQIATGGASFIAKFVPALGAVAVGIKLAAQLHAAGLRAQQVYRWVKNQDDLEAAQSALASSAQNFVRNQAEQLAHYDALASTLTTRNVAAETIRLIERDLASLTRMAESLGALTRQAIDLETETLQASASRSKKQVFWQLLAMVPAALLMIAGFTYLLARPIRDLDAVIHRLGEGKLAQRIGVAGPRDIERLGEQLDWLRQRLIVLEDQKTRFFQHVSHELKTPLTALTEGSSLLSDEVVGQPQCGAARGGADPQGQFPDA